MGKQLELFSGEQLKSLELEGIKISFRGIKVMKRDGREVLLDVERIFNAIEKAFRSTFSEGEDPSKPIMESLKIGSFVLDELKEGVKNGKKVFTVEEIQDLVERKLYDYDIATYHNFHNYREERAREREDAQSIDKTINRLISKESSTVNENANKDSGVFATRRDLTAGVTGKAIGLRMLPLHVSNAHQKGEIHYHDLDYNPYEPMTNCCLIDFKGMLKNGFRMGNADIEPPKSIQTAAAQIAQIIANVASNQYGGCSADRIDELLSPYAKLNFKKHLKDAERWIEDGSKQEKSQCVATRPNL